MKTITFLILSTCFAIGSWAQERQHPLVADFGGIFEIPDADIKPDPNLKYNIVIDLAKASDEKQYADYYLSRVARLMNLHAIGGVPSENLNVKVVIHGPAVYNILNHRSFNQKFQNDNPNILLIDRLIEAGAEVMVCGQSLVGRSIGMNEIHPGVKVATSALTAVTTYQLQGYAVMQY
jgi:intracellular sulfur oxidation DsrE/DsrF family protein